MGRNGRPDQLAELGEERGGRHRAASVEKRGVTAKVCEQVSRVSGPWSPGVIGSWAMPSLCALRDRSTIGPGEPDRLNQRYG